MVHVAFRRCFIFDVVEGVYCWSKGMETLIEMSVSLSTGT